MITAEDYVSFEVAKLLKEKGFDGIVKSYYSETGLEGYMLGMRTTSNSQLESYFYARPTLQMAMKWLREKHNLYADIILHSVNRTLIYEARIDKINSPSDIDVILPQINEPNYENACEAAIKYCLENLIN